MTQLKTKTPRGMRGGTDNEIVVREGSKNIFADLGLPNPEEHLAKARLASAIVSIIEKNRWTQAEAATKLQTVQPTISDIRRGRFRGISVERLMSWLVALDQDVEITVRPAKKHHARLAVAVAAG